MWCFNMTSKLGKTPRAVREGRTPTLMNFYKDLPCAVKIHGVPGAGKTYTEMGLYSTLLDNGYTSEDITAITFRTTSAEDLINNVAHRTGADRSSVKTHVGTIHSVCNRLSGHSALITPEDKNRFLKENNYLPFVKTKKQSLGTDTDEIVQSGDLFDMYTWLKNTQTPAEKWYKYPGYANITMPDKMVPEFVDNYEGFKQFIGKIDFPDMLQRIIDEGIELDTPVLMADEFQDFTTQMSAVFNTWAKSCERVIIAGDPLQSVYGFWGGSPNYYKRFEAEELVLKKSYRLPSQIWKYASRILKVEGMKVPEVEAKPGYTNPIKMINWDDPTPCYGSELHLVRCNYQSGAVALKLAEEGKVYGGLYGWSQAELNLANTIITFREGSPISKEHLLTLVDYYPLKLFGKWKDKQELVNSVISFGAGHIDLKSNFISPMFGALLNSEAPANSSEISNNIFRAKINGILKNHDKYEIMFRTLEKVSKQYKPRFRRNLLTIHGSKGLEAQAVFLHTAITPTIEKALVIPGEESQAEARVWYVGATRAKDALYIVKDAGKYSYPLPEMTA